MEWRVAFKGSKFMANEPRHLSIGFAGGGLSSLIIQLLRDWSHSSPVPVLAEPSDRLISSDCHCTIWASWDLSERELGILVIGVICGLLLLPCIEFLLVLRQAWTLWVRSKLLSTGNGGKYTNLYRAV